MHYYQTVTEAVADLSQRGYKLNFNLSREYLSCADEELHLRPDEFHIDETYRFEGETDPGDEMIVYAVSSEPRSIKGVLVNAYGPYSDEVSAELVAKLQASH
ncbi:MAG: phosphoribosylpyrophosphate synthetase [Bacteroidetes bacterium]|nr:phosphoribosylpyrophosphate synthetase [Bacteroidota bacterium]